jgi:hypothetical protein
VSIRIEIDGLEQLQSRLAAMGSGLDRDLQEGLLDSAKIIASRAQSLAPRRTGRLRGSITPVSEGTSAEVSVTAKRVSRRYPGGYPYPAKIERRRPFLALAVQQEAKHVEERMTKVLDEISAKWGGA